MNLFKKKEKQLSSGDNPARSGIDGEPAEILPAGMTAPDFSLVNASGANVSLIDYRGRSVIIAFYPADWSPVCGDQLALYNEVIPFFEEYDAQLLAISVDGKWSHRAFAEQRGLSFPLLSDFEPKGEVAKEYGVYDDQAGQAKRALFVIDGQGVIQWSYLSPSNVNPGADGIISALKLINS
jgi:peroxiredoxin